MIPAYMPMPGALRVRALHPLVDGDGSCSLIYDLERAAVFEVPEDLQFYVATALETGDLDEDLVGWMISEDLMTAEGWAEDGHGVAEASFSTISWWNLGSAHRRDGELHAAIELDAGPGTAASMDFVFKQSFGFSRVVLQLGWAGSYPGAQRLADLFIEAEDRASAAGQEVWYEIRLDAEAVSPAMVASLAKLPFHVHLHCGSFPGADELEAESWQRVSRAVTLLRDALGDRLIVHCTLGGGARLLELWSWAKEMGVQHLDAAREEPAGEDRVSHVSVLRDYRGDLRAVCEEIADDLEARRVPVEYQPLTRVVRALMSGNGRGSDAGDEFGLVSADAAGESSCSSCWARFLCSHHTPAEERCAVWRTEAEAALQLYHRLSQVEFHRFGRLLVGPSRTHFDFEQLPSSRQQMREF